MTADIRQPVLLNSEYWSNDVGSFKVSEMEYIDIGSHILGENTWLDVPQLSLK